MVSFLGRSGRRIWCPQLRSAGGAGSATLRLIRHGAGLTVGRDDPEPHEQIVQRFRHARFPHVARLGAVGCSSFASAASPRTKRSGSSPNKNLAGDCLLRHGSSSAPPAGNRPPGRNRRPVPQESTIKQRAVHFVRQALATEQLFAQTLRWPVRAWRHDGPLEQPQEIVVREPLGNDPRQIGRRHERPRSTACGSIGSGTGTPTCSRRASTSIGHWWTSAICSSDDECPGQLHAVGRISP